MGGAGQEPHPGRVSGFARPELRPEEPPGRRASLEWGTRYGGGAECLAAG